MKFMLLYMADEMALAEAPAREMDRIVAEKTAVGQEMWAQGKMVSSFRLWPSVTGTRVTLKGGRCAAFDGPFTETKEVLGGFAVVECASKDEAIEWARRNLVFESATVEVRPVWERCLCHGSFSCSSQL